MENFYICFRVRVRKLATTYLCKCTITVDNFTDDDDKPLLRGIISETKGINYRAFILILLCTYYFCPNSATKFAVTLGQFFSHPLTNTVITYESTRYT